MENTASGKNKLTAAVRTLLAAEVADGQPVAVALSGGMDSVALLEAALPLSARWPIMACHVNHGISRNAGRWETFCQQLCAVRGVELVIRRAQPTGAASEEWARQVRMQAFAGLPVRAILAAHHADDQAETVLFRILRGTGAHGMGAMRPCAPLPGAAQLLLLRPLLAIARADITAFARRRRLRWIEDEDNRNLLRRRNFLRWRVMRVLREYFPDSGRTLATAATRFGAASSLLSELADEDTRQAGGDFARGLELAYFRTVGAARLQNWLHVHLLRYSAKFSERGLAEAARQLMTCRGELSLRFAALTLRVWRGRLYFVRLPPSPDFFRVPVAAACARHSFPQIGGALVLQKIRGSGLSGDKIKDRLFAQLRQGGEKLHLSAARATAVSDLLREANMAPWRRRRLPLLFVGEALAAVPGVAVAAPFRAGRCEEGIACHMEWF